MANKRPEHQLPPELYYNDEESFKYSSNSHIVQIQAQMTERAMELLALPDDKTCYLLDIGCGSGISGEVISDAGHAWCGVDVSHSMLKIAKENEECETRDLVLRDIGHGLPFRAGVFDGAISISAIQWLCHAHSTNQNPRKRLHRFFQTLYACLGRGTRAVFQFYPENEQQSQLIMSQANRAGFNGGLVVDFPNSSKAKKVYIVLMTGGQQQLPKALLQESEQQQNTVDNAPRRTLVMDKKGKNGRLVKGSREWIEAKRERAIKHGRDVQHSSKYSGRNRKPRF